MISRCRAAQSFGYPDVVNDAGLQLVLGRLTAHARTARLVRALREAGVDCLLLKGISHELWLYPDGERPLSGDIDVLIAPSHLDAACEAVSRLGMREARDPLGPRREGLELRYLPRDGTGMPVELHQSFHFVRAPIAHCWSVLSSGREQIEVGGVPIDIPALPARAALLGLHAADHGVAGGWVIEDLRRAIRVLSLTEWQLAAEVAAELDALAPFSSGLRMVPAGATIADSLGLDKPDHPALLLRGRSAPDPSIRMLEYADRSSPAGLARLLANEVFPFGDQMRTWYPLARRGRRGLVAAHAVRLARLAMSSPELVSSWRQARTAARHAAR